MCGKPYDKEHTCTVANVGAFEESDVVIDIGEECISQEVISLVVEAILKNMKKGTQ